MRVARVDSETLTVTNIEVAYDGWIAEQPDDPTVILVESTDENPATIGLGYDPGTGLFEQPTAPPA